MRQPAWCPRCRKKRDQEKTIRFTRTAALVIGKEAERRGQTFAGFVGDAALAVAHGLTDLVGSPEDDPIRPLIAAVDAEITALNRIGNNLNQITEAMHRGSLPDHAHAVLERVDQAVMHSYELTDKLMSEGAAHGA